MKIFEIEISNNGYLNCTFKDKDYIKYINYKDILSYLYKESKTCNKTKIVDGNIYLKNEDTEIIIYNYKNNINDKLDLIIEKAKLLKREQTKKRLRKKKIKRVKAIASLAIITIGISSSSILLSMNSSALAVPADKKINSNIVMAKEEDDIENPIYVDYKEPENVDNICIEYEDRTSSEKYINAKKNYKDIISKISKEYGIDPKIMLAIATQERGIHSTVKDTAAIGLMQIELSVWNNQTLTAYNFKNQKNETISITEEKLGDLNFNIKVACMIFQKCLKDSNYKVDIAIQMYNYGYGNILKTFKNYKNQNNNNLNELISNYDEDWLKCRDCIKEGDNQYLEHILSYIEDSNNLCCEKEDETFVNYNIEQVNKIKSRI